MTVDCTYKILPAVWLLMPLATSSSSTLKASTPVLCVTIPISIMPCWPLATAPTMATSTGSLRTGQALGKSHTGPL